MPRKKVFIQEKTKEVVVNLECEWKDCQHRVPHGDFLDFRSHVEEHIKDILPRYENRHSIDNVPEDFVCPWRDCGWDSPENTDELIRHVLFHPFHANIKAVGTKRKITAKLSDCTLDYQGRNLVPDLQVPFICEWKDCDLEINCPYWFYQHVESHVMALDKQRTDDEKGGNQLIVACQWRDCQSTAKNHYKLKEHCRSHTHEKVYACSTCGGMFASMSKFTDHLTRQNTSEYEMYQCSHCLKYCGSPRILRDHMRHHVNNIKCSLCDMTCPNQSALKQHIKFRHSDERPYDCDLCSSKWKTLSDLRRHRECHNSVLSFQCSVDGCNFSARALQTLKRHFKVEHEGDELAKYECHICGVRYTRGTGLTQHLKSKHMFRWPSGHPRFRYKEHEDGIWRLQTVRFESLQLSQQLNEVDTNSLHENSNQETSPPPELGYHQYETLDSPCVASLSTSNGVFHATDNQYVSVNHGENIDDNSSSDNSMEERSQTTKKGTTHNGIQYNVAPHEKKRKEEHCANAQSPGINASEKGESRSGPLRNKSSSVRHHPYQRPLSPSLDVPQTLLALQEAALRLASQQK